jgi:hypothetical protein
LFNHFHFSFLFIPLHSSSFVLGAVFLSRNEES